MGHHCYPPTDCVYTISGLHRKIKRIPPASDARFSFFFSFFLSRLRESPKRNCWRKNSSDFTSSHRAASPQFLSIPRFFTRAFVSAIFYPLCSIHTLRDKRRKKARERLHGTSVNAGSFNFMDAGGNKIVWAPYYARAVHHRYRYVDLSLVASRVTVPFHFSQSLEKKKKKRKKK